MREVGLEPTQVASLPPQSSASANSATPACKSDHLTELAERNQDTRKQVWGNTSIKWFILSSLEYLPKGISLN